MLDLDGVVVADHVPRKSDHALPGEIDATGGDASEFIVHQPALLPMPVRIEDGRERTRAFAKGAIKIASQIEPRISLERDFFHGVAVALNPAEDFRVQWSLFRKRPKPATDQDLFADLCRPRFPFCSGLDFGE